MSKEDEEYLESLKDLIEKRHRDPRINLPEKAEEFLGQLIDSYPKEDFPTLRKVIGLGKVIYEDRELIPGMPMTAAVMNTKPYTLVFGRKFLEDKMDSLEDCTYILSHELTHLVLDHFSSSILEEFKEKKLAQKAAHIIVDCQVNATVVNSLTDPKYHEFIKRYYHKEAVPYCFFRPDGVPNFNIAGSKPDMSDELTVKVVSDGKFDSENPEKTDPKLIDLMKFEPTLQPLQPERAESLQKLHKKLYSANGITNKELIEGLMPWFEEQQGNLDDVIKELLGNHRDIFKDKGINSADDSLSDVTKAVATDMANYLDKKEEEKKEQAGEKGKEGKDGKEGKEKPGEGCGKGEKPREQQIKTCLDKLEYVKNIKERLKKTSVNSPSSKIFKAIDNYIPKRPARSVIPNFHDRRTSLLFSLGKLPIFNKYPEYGTRTIVPCYLDVSGSQDHVMPFTLPVVSRLKDKIGDAVFCFSTYVSETKICNLREGKISSSGGTDFNPVAEHIIKNNFKHAVILTDGDANLSPELADKLRRKNVHITVGWTVASPRKDALMQVAKKSFYVFKDGKDE